MCSLTHNIRVNSYGFQHSFQGLASVGVYILNKPMTIHSKTFSTFHSIVASRQWVLYERLCRWLDSCQVSFAQLAKKRYILLLCTTRGKKRTWCGRIRWSVTSVTLNKPRIFFLHFYPFSLYFSLRHTSRSRKADNPLDLSFSIMNSQTGPDARHHSFKSI